MLLETVHEEAHNYLELVFEVAKKSLIEGQNQQAEHDKNINDIYHVFEYLDIDAVTMMRLAKKLKYHLRQRRIMKEDVARAQSLIHTLEPILKKKKDIEKAAAKRALDYKIESEVSLKRLLTTV